MTKPEAIWSLSCRLYRKGFTPLARVLKTYLFLVHNAVLPYQAEIQSDIRLEHFALGIVIHPNVTIGHRVRIYQHVTIAAETPVGSPFRVVVGDDVTIGANAVVIARTNTTLLIGNGAVIGAGAVVTRDVPSGDTVVGIPARSIKRESPGSSD